MTVEMVQCAHCLRDEPIQVLARELGVTPEAIGMIRRGVNWRWL